MYNLDLLIFRVNTLQRYYIVEKLHLILMKSTFVQIGIYEIFLELIKNLLNKIDMIRFVNINQDVIQIDNYKNV